MFVKADWNLNSRKTDEQVFNIFEPIDTGVVKTSEPLLSASFDCPPPYPRKGGGFKLKNQI